MSISETISLRDNVSKPALAAANAISKIASSANEAIAAVTRLADKLKSMGAINLKAATAESLLSVKAVSAAKTAADKVAAKEEANARKAAANEVANAFKLAAKAEAEATRAANKIAHTERLDQIRLEQRAASLAAQAVARANSQASAKTIEHIQAIAGTAGWAASSFIRAAESFAERSVGLLRQGVELAIQSTTAHHDAVEAIKQITHNERLAENVYSDLVHLGRDLGKTRESTIESFKKLTSTGFSTGQSEAIIEQIANLDKGRGVGSGNKLQMLLTRVQATGKVDNATLRAGARQLGLSTNDLIQDLAKRTGESVDIVTQRLKKGQIESSKGIDAILGMVDKRFGGLGKKAGETVPGLVSAIKDQFVGLFDDVDLDPLRKTLKQVKATLDGPLGGELKHAVGGLFGGVIDAIFGKADAGSDRVDRAVRKIIDGIHGLTTAIQIGSDIVHHFLDGFVTGFEKAYNAADKPAGGSFLDSLKTDLPTILPKVSKLGESFGNLAVKLGEFLSQLAGVGGKSSPAIEAMRNLADAVNAVAWLVHAPGAAANSVGGAVLDVLPKDDKTQGQASKIGNGICDGLERGILAGLAGPQGAAWTLVSSVLDVVHKGFDQHSPSKVFETVGIRNDEGLAIGHEKGIPRVTESVATVTRSAVSTASNNTASGGGNSTASNDNGGDRISITIGDINVVEREHSTAQQTGEDIAAAVERGIRRHLLQMVIAN